MHGHRPVPRRPDGRGPGRGQGAPERLDARSRSPIDGKADEWAPEALETEKSVDVAYGFKNDDKNLYLFFKFNDAKKYMSSIEQTGFTLWVNPKARRRRSTA